MFDPRNNLANEVSAQLIEHFGDKVFRTMIPRNVRLAEAPSFGKPALFHDKESRGALAYLALAGEMIRRDDLPAAARIIAKNWSHWDASMTGKKPSPGPGSRRALSLLAQPRRRASRRKTADVAVGDRLACLPLDLLQRGKYQPRADMRPESLRNSRIRSSRRAGAAHSGAPARRAEPSESQRYEIIAGERRWRAAQMAGLDGDSGGHSRRAR